MTIREGDVIKIKSHPMWVGTLMEVTEARSWGAIGIVRGPNGLEYPLRVNLSEIETVYRKVEGTH